MSLPENDYAKWNEQELLRAESVAACFLQENEEQIRENLEAKIHALQALVSNLGLCPMDLDQRLNCFARIAEVSRALEEDAEGFFNLASEPVVARLLAKVENRSK